MWYAIIAEDMPNSLAKRLAARPAHVARLQTLQAEGRLFVAGPHPAIDSEDPAEAGFTGSLIIAEFANLAAARVWAAVFDLYPTERRWRGNIRQFEHHIALSFKA